jgi:hypothetical protein
MGVALNWAKYFIICNSNGWVRRDLDVTKIKGLILQSQHGTFKKYYNNKLSLIN